MIQEKVSKGELVEVPSGATIFKKGGMSFLYDQTVEKPFLAIFENEIDEYHCKVIDPDGATKIVYYSELYKPKGIMYGSEIKQERKTTWKTTKEQNFINSSTRS